MKHHRFAIAGILASFAIGLASSVNAQSDPLPHIETSVSADSLRGHLSFIASDLLEGRETPSPGLDIAAHYIAAQFRRAGLEPVGDDGYFQTTTITTPRPRPSDFACSLQSPTGQVFSLTHEQISIFLADKAIDLEDAPLILIDFDAIDAEQADDPADEPHQSRAPEGQAADHAPVVVITRMPPLDTIATDERRDFFARLSRLNERARAMNAAAILAVDATREAGSGLTPSVRRGARGDGPALIYVHGVEVSNRLDTLEASTNGRVDLHYAPPREVAVEVRNVAGLLRGSDPELADTYILVTAHYDHVGTGTPVDGDAIYNGANDDGSGTVAVLELASSLASLPIVPRRSILFLCVYGEEKGLLGSRHYVRNPLVPLVDTVANVNLEHVGRVDDSQGDTRGTIMPTGYGYSTMIEPFIEAGKATGIEIVHRPRESVQLFQRSDNAAFAGAGIPAHTFCTSFIFPDYHGAHDHWDRINYQNLERVVETIGLGIHSIAMSETRPEWNPDHRATGRFIQARQLREQAAQHDRDDSK